MTGFTLAQSIRAELDSVSTPLVQITATRESWVEVCDALDQMPKIGEESDQWRCFHCHETFTDRAEAHNHFGGALDQDAACRIAPDLRGLIDIIRTQEAELREYRAEDNTDSAKQFYRMGAEHYVAVRDAEQAGYDKGLADGIGERAALPKPAPKWFTVALSLFLIGTMGTALVAMAWTLISIALKVCP